MTPIITLLLLLCLQILPGQQQQNSSQIYNKNDDDQLVQLWKKVTYLVSFQNTIQAFPHIKDNIKVERIIELLGTGACGISQGYPAFFTISDNKIYTHGLNRTFQRVVDYKLILEKISQRLVLPDMYFGLVFWDGLYRQMFGIKNETACMELPLFIFSKNSSDSYSNSKFLIPDSYVAKADYKQSYEQMLEQSKKISWEQKSPKIFFRGGANAPYTHFRNIGPQTNFTINYHRVTGVMMSVQHPDEMDIKFIDDSSDIYKQVKRRVGNKTIYSNYVPMKDHLKYRYLFVADGWGAAWRRVPLILSSNSLMVKPYSDNIQWFYDLVKPNEHYLPLKNDLSDLLPKLKLMQNDKQKPLQMIKNANSLAQKYFSPEGIQNYIYNTFVKYAKIQNLSLSAQDKKDISQGADLALIFHLKHTQERWNAISKWLNFKQTIDGFDFLKRNIQIQNMNELLSKGGCGESVLKFTISNYELLCEGAKCYQNQAVQVKKMIERVAEKYNLPNMQFLVHPKDEQLNADKLPKDLHQICRQLPLFVLRKNSTSAIQETKFLLPNPTLLHWAKERERLKQQQKFNAKPWEERTNKAYFNGSIAPSVKLASVMKLNQSQIVESFDLAKFMTLSKKHPFIVQASIITRELQYRDLQYRFINTYGGRNYLGFQFFSRYQTPKQQTYQNYKYLLASENTDTPYHSIPSILSSRSVMLSQFNGKSEWYYNKLVPGANFILLQSGINHMFSMITSILNSDARGRRIAESAYNLAQEIFTVQSIQKYIVRSLLQYNSFQQLGQKEGGNPNQEWIQKRIQQFFSQYEEKQQNERRIKQNDKLEQQIQNLKRDVEQIAKKQQLIEKEANILQQLKRSLQKERIVVQTERANLQKNRQNIEKQKANIQQQKQNIINDRANIQAQKQKIESIIQHENKQKDSQGSTRSLVTMIMTHLQNILQIALLLMVIVLLGLIYRAKKRTNISEKRAINEKVRVNQTGQMTSEHVTIQAKNLDF